MYDPGNGQLRYLVHFDDGGSGMRTRDEPLEPGAELVDGGSRYRVVLVELAPNPQAFGHVRVGSADADGVLRENACADPRRLIHQPSLRLSRHDA